MMKKVEDQAAFYRLTRLLWYLASGNSLMFRAKPLDITTS
jgi:hypothetical protein